MQSQNTKIDMFVNLITIHQWRHIASYTTGDTCSCCYLGNKYTPNITDECESFTQTFQGAEYSVSCSPGLAFDLQTCVCEWSHLVQCKECNS